MDPNIDNVRAFWQNNPLWTGESKYPAGSREFFAEHRQTYIEDCFAGSLDERIFPLGSLSDRVLDLGCGPGFWTVELGLRGCSNLWACDLTENAVQLAKRRCDLYGCKAEFLVGNAESLSIGSGYFTHVNCQGVIHHTPDTPATVSEIARVLCDGGTASGPGHDVALSESANRGLAPEKNESRFCARESEPQGVQRTPGVNRICQSGSELHHTDARFRQHCAALRCLRGLGLLVRCRA